LRTADYIKQAEGKRESTDGHLCRRADRRRATVRGRASPRRFTNEIQPSRCDGALGESSARTPGGGAHRIGPPRRVVCPGAGVWSGRGHDRDPGLDHEECVGLVLDGLAETRAPPIAGWPDFLAMEAEARSGCCGRRAAEPAFVAATGGDRTYRGYYVLPEGGGSTPQSATRIGHPSAAAPRAAHRSERRWSRSRSGVAPFMARAPALVDQPTRRGSPSSLSLPPVPSPTRLCEVLPSSTGGTP